ncbi:MAG: hypothetical protein ACTHOH_08795 [Lysobacteraceae bacterium]
MGDKGCQILQGEDGVEPHYLINEMTAFDPKRAFEGTLSSMISDWFGISQSFFYKP